jgi:hypothetical protein
VICKNRKTMNLRFLLTLVSHFEHFILLIAGLLAVDNDMQMGFTIKREI